MSKAVTYLLRALAAGLGGLFSSEATQQRAMSREFDQLRTWQEDLDRRCGC